jgi:hypothetical protein
LLLGEEGRSLAFVVRMEDRPLMREWVWGGSGYPGLASSGVQEMSPRGLGNSVAFV